MRWKKSSKANGKGAVYVSGSFNVWRARGDALWTLNGPDQSRVFDTLRDAKNAAGNRNKWHRDNR